MPFQVKLFHPHEDTPFKTVTHNVGPEVKAAEHARSVLDASDETVTAVEVYEGATKLARVAQDAAGVVSTEFDYEA